MAEIVVSKSEEAIAQISSNTRCISKQELQIVEKANERPEWLPDGWTMDVRTRKSGVHMGSEYKCYIDPLKGYKFYSKPEVLRYLETIKDNSCSPKKPKKENSCNPKKEKKEISCIPNQEKKENCCTLKEEKRENSCTLQEEKKENSCAPKEEKKFPNIESPSNVVIEKSTAEDLPPGWIKEVKIRKNPNGSIRKDPSYKDPVSGYVFRSKKEVQRYLETGDKPSRRQIQVEDKLTPSPAAKRQKLKQSAPKQELFAGKEIFDKSSLELPDANSSRKGQDVNVQSRMMVTPVSVVKMQSLEDGAENLSEMKKRSHTDDIEEKEHVGNMESANEKNHSSPSISKKEEFNVRNRFSPRLAGIEPVQMANNVINEQNLQVLKRNMRKNTTTLDAVLENKSSHHVNGIPETEHAHKMQQEVINTSNNLSEDQAAAKERPNKLETDKIDDNMPEIHTNSNKSNNKRDHHIPCRASKRLAGFDNGLMNSSISCEETPKYQSKRSKDEISAELQQSEGGLATELADHAPINGESANKRRKSPKIPSIGDDQREKLQGGGMNDEKSEPPTSFAFHYSWSNPSLEYAINTLTSVLPVEDSVDTGSITVPQTEIKNKLFDNVTGRSRDRNDPQVRSNKSKKEKELKMPMRVSKRLAGLEPDVRPSERAVEYATKKKCKEEPTATESLTNGAPDHLDAEEETKITCHASSHSSKTEVLGESSNKSNKSYDSQTVPEDQLQKVEAENIGDERSELQLPRSFGESWSDPCLEFAFKTLTGALPFDAATDVLPVITPDVNNLPNKELHESVVTSISEEAHYNSNQSQNKKEPNMVRQPAELLPRQPELRTGSTSCKNAPNFIIRDSCGDEGFTTRNLDGESVHMDVGNVTQHVQHSGNLNALIHKEPLKEKGQVLGSESVITGQPQLETATTNHVNSESHFCASFMNSWSDPCLEFAFKTLTGVIPVDDNLAIQGCFQQPANCHNRTDGSSMLPDFGPSCFSQSDFPFHYDLGVNSIPGQQSSMSNPFLPMEKGSLQGCPQVDPQKQYSQCNRNFQSQKKLQRQAISCIGEQEVHLVELSQAMEVAGHANPSFPTQGFYPQYYHSFLILRSYPDRQFQDGSTGNPTTSI